MTELLRELEAVVLLPCPFCGFEPEVFPKDPKAEGNAWTKVQCTHKGCGLAAAEAYQDRGHRRAAFKLWNKRTHHAEIAEAVRDARRIDFLQREVDTIGAFLLHNGIGIGKGFTGLGLKNTKRTLRRAIDQCLEAEAIDAHNSAREVGE